MSSQWGWTVFHFCSMWSMSAGHWFSCFSYVLSTTNIYPIESVCRSLDTWFSAGHKVDDIAGLAPQSVPHFVPHFCAWTSESGRHIDSWACHARSSHSSMRELDTSCHHLLNILLVVEWELSQIGFHQSLTGFGLTCLIFWSDKRMLWYFRNHFLNGELWGLNVKIKSG